MAFVKKPVTIKSGTAVTVETVLDTEIGNQGLMALVGILMPAVVDANALSVQFSFDGGSTFKPIVDSTGTAKTITQTAGKYVTLPASDYPCIPGPLNLSAAGNAAADRTYVLVFRSV